MWRNSISLMAFACLAACTTDKEHLLPAGSASMMDVWNRQTGEATGSLAGRRILDARLALRRPVIEPFEAHAWSRDSANEIDAQFKRLPNPDLVMFVFPHLAGANSAPIPGYSTVFPMYSRVQYAMPGERTGGEEE
ncbi:MAG: TIGR03751 family conjugal transfer lipoprotein [Azoarcus sp.]|jgi:conjugative transfer region lipoprotein (TIGR03751 family)|nr:TIGR03751 family conjugal transfer lipoprotein [Azoarcus sp.]